MAVIFRVDTADATDRELTALSDMLLALRAERNEVKVPGYDLISAKSSSGAWTFGSGAEPVASIGAAEDGAEPVASIGAAEDGAELPAVDARGFPWDERIHSSSHTLTTEGNWRARRNVAAETVATVEAELSAVTGQYALDLPVSPPPSAVPPPPPPAAVVPDDETPSGMSALNAPPPPPPPVTPALPPAAQVMRALGPHMREGRLSMDGVLAAVAALGVAGGVVGFNDHPEMVPAFYQALGITDAG